ncbi:MAG: PAC2 family protein [Candidatus Hermodarchaeota archaeon]|nr:PAC2 family protein [Candidatus Hermodarchaeota archaeon]
MAKKQPSLKQGADEPFIQIVPIDESVKLAKEPVLVIGFPGPGLVGMISTGRMIEGLDLKLIGAIRSPLIPPITPFFGGRLRLPVRIHASADGKLLTVISEVALAMETIFYVASRILDWATENGVKKVICLEGIGVQQRSGTPEVFGAAEPQLMEELEKFSVPRVDKGFVAGIAGAILNECLIRNLDGYCLLVTAAAEYPDPEAAASILTTVNRFLDLDVSIQPLVKNQSVIKAQLNDLAKEAYREERAAQEHGYRPIPFYV